MAHRERVVERHVVHERRGPLRRLVSGVASLIGFGLLLVVLLVVLIVVLL
jgi:hypothetical protein